MTFFYVMFMIVILQRLVELRLAKHNERWLLKHGGYEVGRKHYKYIVMLHVSFFLSLFIEVLFFEREMLSVWYVVFFLFLLVQLLRIWTMTSLGVYWNTKIIVVPGAKVVQKGPYKWLRHPNYLVVMLEIFLLPLIFQAYVTLFLFTVLNFVMLLYRIGVEEEALCKATNYDAVFHSRNRLLPKWQTATGQIFSQNNGKNEQ